MYKDMEWGIFGTVRHFPALRFFRKFFSKFFLAGPTVRLRLPSAHPDNYYACSRPPAAPLYCFDLMLCKKIVVNFRRVN